MLQAGQAEASKIVDVHTCPGVANNLMITKFMWMMIYGDFCLMQVYVSKGIPNGIPGK